MYRELVVKLDVGNQLQNLRKLRNFLVLLSDQKIKMIIRNFTSIVPQKLSNIALNAKFPFKVLDDTIFGF